MGTDEAEMKLQSQHINKHQEVDWGGGGALGREWGKVRGGGEVGGGRGRASLRWSAKLG